MARAVIHVQLEITRTHFQRVGHLEARVGDAIPCGATQTGFEFPGENLLVAKSDTSGMPPAPDVTGRAEP